MRGSLTALAILLGMMTAAYGQNTSARFGINLATPFSQPVCIYDQSNTCVSFGSLDSVSHIFTIQDAALSVGYYLGTWNAATNVPPITSGVGINGNFFLVGTAGSTTIDGNSAWTAGDQIRFSGTVWQRIASNNSVVSVSGRTGAISLTSADLTDSTSIGRAVIGAASQAAGQNALGAGSVGAQVFAAATQAAALAAIGATTLFTPPGNGGISRSIQSKLAEGCISIDDYGSYPNQTGLDSGPAILKATAFAASSGKGCVLIPGNSYDVGPIIINAYNNITYYCQASSANAANGTKLYALTLTEVEWQIGTNGNPVGGITFEDCSWYSHSQQTAGSYVVAAGLGTNSLRFTNPYMTRGYDPLILSDAALVYLTNLTIRNTADKALWITGTSGSAQGGAHDIYAVNPIMDQDDETNPNIQAGVYIDQSGGSVLIEGGDILHQHNNYWLNPGSGQIVIWEFCSLCTFDSADFPDQEAARQGTDIKITPHNGGIANGNTFSNFWASTGSLASIQVQGDNATGTTCQNNQFSQPMSLHSYQQSIIIGGGCDKTIISSPNITGASITTPGSYCAIDILGDAKDVTIHGGSVGAGNGYLATQKFNLCVESGYINTLIVDGVNLNAPTGSGLTSPYYISPSAFPAFGSVIANSPGVNFKQPAILSTTASPYTFTAAIEPQMFTASNSSSQINLTINGITVCIAQANTTCNVELAPGQAVTVTYTGGTLTAATTIH